MIFPTLNLFVQSAGKLSGSGIKSLKEKNTEFVKNAAKKHKIMRLKEKYQKGIIPQMIEKFGYKSVMAVPKIDKVVVNTGFGKIVSDKTSEEQKKFYEAVLNDLTLICGQKVILTKAKIPIAGFKTRKGMPIGAKATLRGKRMYDFLERLINFALPRSRDFRGLEVSSFDRKGNLTIGIEENICFPEILPEKVRNIFGFEITVVTTAKTKEEGIELLKLLGFPIMSRVLSISGNVPPVIKM